MEEEMTTEKEYTEEEKNNAMSVALQWLCSPRGGNNFYGRILNGCGRAPRKDLWPPTAAVSLDTKGRYMLIWQPDWFVRQDGPFQLLVVVHEAAHLALQHLEKSLRLRLKVHDPIKFKRLEPVMNVAQDMAANDIAVRPLINDTRKTVFAKYKKEFIWPEDRSYPTGETVEYYFNELLRDLKAHGFDENLPTAPVLGGLNGNQSNQPDSSGQQGQSGGNAGTPESDKGDSSTAPSPTRNAPPSGATTEPPTPSTGGTGTPDNQDTDDADNGGGSGVGEDHIPPGDLLDDNYPQWFKDLLNQQNPPNIPSDLQFDEMTSAEIERAIDRAKREAKRITKNAIEQTKKSRGTLPGAFMQAIENLLHEPTIPWQIVFKNMMRSELSSKLDESTAYPNPSFFHLEDEGMEPYPGFQKNFAFSMSVMVDTSGSVSQKDFLDFMAEIKGIMDQEDEVSVRLIMFDAAIQYEKVLSSDDTEKFAKERYTSINRYGCGGTDFSPPLRYMCGMDTENDWAAGAVCEEQPMKDPPDMAIILTDGYAPVGPPHGPIPKYLPACPLIWVLTSNGNEDDYMQPRVLKIDN